MAATPQYVRGPADGNQQPKGDAQAENVAMASAEAAANAQEPQGAPAAPEAAAPGAPPGPIPYDASVHGPVEHANPLLGASLFPNQPVTGNSPKAGPPPAGSAALMESLAYAAQDPNASPALRNLLALMSDQAQGS